MEGPDRLYFGLAIPNKQQTCWYRNGGKCKQSDTRHKNRLRFMLLLDPTLSILCQFIRNSVEVSGIGT